MPTHRPANAVVGTDNLTPGVYKIHWTTRDAEYFFLADPTVLSRPGLSSRTIKTVRAFHFDGSMVTVFLGDAGILPRKAGTTEVCNLGHSHTSEPTYSDAWTERVDNPVII